MRCDGLWCARLLVLPTREELARRVDETRCELYREQRLRGLRGRERAARRHDRARRGRGNRQGFPVALAAECDSALDLAWHGNESWDGPWAARIRPVLPTG